MIGTYDIEVILKEDSDEEQQIENEMLRLKNDLSMDLASERGKQSKISTESEEEDEQNFQIGTIRRVKQGGKKRRDRIMYRAYQPDDGQLSFLNCRFPDPRESI